jgi:hypothetical protein
VPARRWEHLVRELSQTGYESEYLDRLRARVDVEQAMEDLETEIIRETAAALGRAAEKVDYALLRLELAGRDVECATSRGAWLRAVNRFNAIRAEALEARHELIIHREAVGIRRDAGIVEAMYPIPAAIRPWE